MERALWAKNKHISATHQAPMEMEGIPVVDGHVSRHQLPEIDLNRLGCSGSGWDGA